MVSEEDYRRALSEIERWRDLCAIDIHQAHVWAQKLGAAEANVAYLQQRIAELLARRE